MTVKKITTATIRQSKNKAEPLVVLTAYHAGMASIIDSVADIILVGDSLGMTLHGLPSTIPVTTDMMILATQAVVRGSTQALIVTDLPFGSYESSPQQAFETAVKIIQQGGCSAVKLEGGVAMQDTIAFLTQRGIPVMAHIGLQPQSVNAYGGYKVQGRTQQQAETLMQDALAVQNAGAFACVLEGIKESVAKDITEKLDIPTIGIGASSACDGQVLVTDDLLGLTQNTPKFAKKYIDLQSLIKQAVQDYANDVRGRTFPSQDYVY